MKDPKDPYRSSDRHKSYTDNRNNPHPPANGVRSDSHQGGRDNPGPGGGRPQQGFQNGGRSNDRPPGPNQGQGQGQGRRHRRRSHKRPGGNPNSERRDQFNAPRPADSRMQEKSRTSYVPKKNNGGRPDIFELFCAYHLGITANGGFKVQNIHDLARRFGCTPAEIKQALIDYRMDPETLINSDFDFALAQLDFQVAPEGVDRWELARPWFEEFLASHPNARDWNKELANDAQENEKIFGKE